ncbi:YkgJ family cysteine cluster protein [Leptolyngbya sp. AN02str]|uniref:YkgJ family cysteine cluster protein n=1 Tax=Leptolyngbya sp. AN02str TaxID=3423363 RepID=UPI003D31D874
MVSFSSANLDPLDAQIEQRVHHIRAVRDWWPCQKGCDRCCRQLATPPELTEAEWARVDAAVALLPDTVHQSIRDRIHQLVNQIVGNMVQGSVICPYLDQEAGACLIYEARPIACRTYGFYVGRDRDLYCTIVETEVENRGDRTIMWGNADSMDHQLAQAAGKPIPFEVHYEEMGDRA